MKLKKLLAGLMSLCFITMVGQHVHAQTITYSDSYTDLLTELVDEPLRVDFFDTALGTLNGVEVTMSGFLQSFGSVTNTASQNQDFAISMDHSSCAYLPMVLADKRALSGKSLQKLLPQLGLSSHKLGLRRGQLGFRL